MVQLSPPGVTPNRGMGPTCGAFCQITLTSCFLSFSQVRELGIRKKLKKIKVNSYNIFLRFLNFS